MSNKKGNILLKISLIVLAIVLAVDRKSVV